MYEFALRHGLGWPLPLGEAFLRMYIRFRVLEQQCAASCYPRIMAAASHLADSDWRFFEVPRDAKRYKRVMRRFRRSLELKRPHAPKGKAPIPAPSVTIPRMLRFGVVLPRDKAAWPRFLLLLNTGMRGGESSWCNLLLSDVRVFFNTDGSIYCIAFEIRNSKTRKTRADALIKVIFPRDDIFDAVRPFLLFLSSFHGIVPRPTAVPLGCSPPPLSAAPLPLFPCEAPGVAPKYQRKMDVQVMTNRIRSWARAAGLAEEVVRKLSAHSGRVTFSNSLRSIGAQPSFIDRVVGWGVASGSVYYTRESGVLHDWRQASTLLAHALALPTL